MAAAARRVARRAAGGRRAGALPPPPSSSPSSSSRRWLGRGPRVVSVEVEAGRQWAQSEAREAAAKAAKAAEEAAAARAAARAAAEHDRAEEEGEEEKEKEKEEERFRLRDAFHGRLVPGQVWRYQVRDPLYDRNSALVIGRVEEAPGLPDAVVHVVVAGAHVQDPTNPDEVLRDCCWHIPMYAKAVVDSVTANVGTATEEDLRQADFAFSYKTWRERYEAAAFEDKAGEAVDLPVAQVITRLEQRMAEAARDPELAAAMEQDSPGLPVPAESSPEAEVRLENLKRKYRGTRKSAKVPEDFPEELLPYVPGYQPESEDVRQRLVERRAKAREMPDFTEIP